MSTVAAAKAMLPRNDAVIQRVAEAAPQVSAAIMQYGQLLEADRPINHLLRSILNNLGTISNAEYRNIVGRLNTARSSKTIGETMTYSASTLPAVIETLEDGRREVTSPGAKQVYASLQTLIQLRSGAFENANTSNPGQSKQLIKLPSVLGKLLETSISEALIFIRSASHQGVNILNPTLAQGLGTEELKTTKFKISTLKSNAERLLFYVEREGDVVKMKFSETPGAQSLVQQLQTKHLTPGTSVVYGRAVDTNFDIGVPLVPEAKVQSFDTLVSRLALQITFTKDKEVVILDRGNRLPISVCLDDTQTAIYQPQTIIENGTVSYGKTVFTGSVVR